MANDGVQEYKMINQFAPMQDYFKEVVANPYNYFTKLPKNEVEVKEAFTKLQNVFKAEQTSTQEMWKIYQRYLTGDATVNELNKANKIAQDLCKTTGFGLLLTVPGVLFVLPAIIKMAKEYGVDVVPSSIASEFAI